MEIINFLSQNFHPSKTTTSKLDKIRLSEKLNRPKVVR